MGCTQIVHTTMHLLLLLLASVPSLNAVCLIQGCGKWYDSVKTNVTIKGACAVMFDENCCKSSRTFHIIKKGEEGKLCGLVSSFNPLSSCSGPRLKDDVEDAKEEEAKSFNDGNLRDSKDRYDRNKLVISAKVKPNFVEEIDDDFDDMDEDIESYRCKC